MAQIIKRGTRYTARIRIIRGGRVAHQETQTFGSRQLAAAWATKRETALRQPGALESVTRAAVTVEQCLAWYLEDFDGRTKFGRSKLTNINMLLGHPVADLDALRLTSGQLMRFIRDRRAAGAGPSTVTNDLIWLKNALRSARISRDVPVCVQAIDDAMFLARRERLVARAAERSRRPELDELDRLLTHFAGATGETPMVDIVLFALFSSRRQEEITRIRGGAGLDNARQMVLVPEMKHPRQKIDTWCYVPDPAWRIIKRRENGNELLFPHNSRTVSSLFTRACRVLGIDDLRFHDLRHECISWLFDTGLDIPRVARVSGHRSWASLKRYARLDVQEPFDKYSGWSWLP